jgi:hypothetical protein
MASIEQLGAADPDVAVSVITVSWNVRELLLDCIASVFASAGALKAEMIVVDNASADGSADAVAQRFPDVVVIRNTENAGFARANNQGLAVAHGRHILFLNPDTRVVGDAIPQMVRLMDQTPAIGAVGAKLLTKELRWSRDNGFRLPTLRTVVNDYLKLTSLLPFPRLVPGIVRSADFTGVDDCDWVSGAAIMVRRAVAETERWDESIFFFAEDIEYCRRIGRAGWRVTALGNACVVHDSGRSMVKQNDAFLANRVSATARLLGAETHPASAWLAVRIIRVSLLARSHVHRLMYWWSGDTASLDKSRRLRQYLSLERSKV